MNEFMYCWNNTYALDMDLIKKHSNQLDYAIERWDMDYERASCTAKPNYMQRRALKELNRYRVMCVGGALIISAAGARFILWTGRKAV